MKKKAPRHVAHVYCKGCAHTQIKENHEKCSNGCTACGECVNVCESDAIHVNETGVAVVDTEKCLDCGDCSKVCPQGIIHSNIADNAFLPLCSNKQAGAKAKKECDNSCIACGICEKNCPTGAILIRENHAVINEEKCTNCGFCLVKCPRNVIVDARGIIVKKGRVK